MSKREKLERQIEEVESLKTKRDSPEFNAWKTKTKRILESLF